MPGSSATEPTISLIGFIGLGVMGEPMCGHLARRSGLPVMAHDLRAEPLQSLAEHDVKAASLQQIAAACDVILLSLPDGRAVSAVVEQLEPHLRAGAPLGPPSALSTPAPPRSNSPARSARG